MDSKIKLSMDELIQSKGNRMKTMNALRELNRSLSGSDEIVSNVYIFSSEGTICYQYHMYSLIRFSRTCHAYKNI